MEGHSCANSQMSYATRAKSLVNVESSLRLDVEPVRDHGKLDLENSYSLLNLFQSDSSLRVVCNETESDSECDVSVGNLRHYVCRYIGYKQEVQPGQLIFNASFESGNLSRVQFITECEYDLTIRSDTCNPKQRIWFNFTVSNARKDQIVIFNIVNYSRERSLYREGMGPVVCSTTSPHWERVPPHLVFFYRSPEHGNRYVLTFVFQFPSPHDRYQFAYSYPYTYSRLTAYLKQLCALSPAHLSVDRLCSSIQQRDVHLLTISAHRNFLTGSNQQIVFITARVHPGESPSSFVTQGLIDFLLSLHPAARALRDALVFKIVPMLNPDGVVLGNYRCSLMGEDLNRHWRDPSPFIHPALYHTKQLLTSLDKDPRVRLDFYIDIHAHSTLSNGFMYGNVYEDEGRFERQLRFPKLLSARARDFSWSRTVFDRDAVKAGTSRRCFGSCLNQNTLCYTMEVSLFSYTTRSQQHRPYTEQGYCKLGRNVALALFDYYKLKTY